MPKRPREHQLEDQSRNAFCVCLPPQWVFRDAVPDYGIDGTIEVFDVEGRSTGKLFLVQLKATDQADLDKALTIVLSRETYEYHRCLDLPVLIVRFHAP